MDSTRSTTTRATSGPYIVYRDQMRFFRKTTEICSTGCYRVDSTTTIIIPKKEQDSCTASRHWPRTGPVQTVSGIQSLRDRRRFRFKARGVRKREQLPPNPIRGGGVSKLSQVTCHIQQFHSITLGHDTSWNTDYGGKQLNCHGDIITSMHTCRGCPDP